MPRPTPEQLQEYRRRSGRLGGRPKKPTSQRPSRSSLRSWCRWRLRVKQKAMGAYLDGEGEAGPAVRASDDVLDRSWGRATQRTEVTHDGEPVGRATDEELRAMLRVLEGGAAVAEAS